jgi:hypothetical protein
MAFFRRRTNWRSVAAIFAAYALVLHAFLGAIFLSQSAAASSSITSPFVICQVSGASHDNGLNDGQAPVAPVSCFVYCASHVAGAVPPVLPDISVAVTEATALPLIAVAGIARAPEHSPKSAQAPPASV